MRTKTVIAAGLAGALAVMAGFEATAELPDKPGPARSVGIFDTVCMETVPALEKVEAMASANTWTPITGSALRAYAPQVEPELLKAWELNDFGIKLKIAISKAPVDQAMAEQLPKFAKGKAYGCSLILPGTAPATEIAANMAKMMERPPDESFDQGPLKASFWQGATDDFVVLIYHYAPKNGQPGGLLSVTLMQNE